METSKSLEIVLKQDKNGKLENETRGYLHDSLELIEVIESPIDYICKNLGGMSMNRYELEYVVGDGYLTNTHIQAANKFNAVAKLTGLLVKDGIAVEDLDIEAVVKLKPGRSRTWRVQLKYLFGWHGTVESLVEANTAVEAIQATMDKIFGVEKDVDAIMVEEVEP